MTWFIAAVHISANGALELTSALDLWSLATEGTQELLNSSTPQLLNSQKTERMRNLIFFAENVGGMEENS